MPAPRDTVELMAFATNRLGRTVLELEDATVSVAGRTLLDDVTWRLGPGDRVLLIDDVLATGGTAAATAELVRRCGAEPAALAVLMELSFLPGRDAIGDLPLTSLQVL